MSGESASIVVGSLDDIDVKTEQLVHDYTKEVKHAVYHDGIEDSEIEGYNPLHSHFIQYWEVGNHTLDQLYVCFLQNSKIYITRPNLPPLLLVDKDMLPSTTQSCLCALSIPQYVLDHNIKQDRNQASLVHHIRNPVLMNPYLQCVSKTPHSGLQPNIISLLSNTNFRILELHNCPSDVQRLECHGNVVLAVFVEQCQVFHVDWMLNQDEIYVPSLTLQYTLPIAATPSSSVLRKAYHTNPAETSSNVLANTAHSMMQNIKKNTQSQNNLIASAPVLPVQEIHYPVSSDATLPHQMTQLQLHPVAQSNGYIAYAAPCFPSTVEALKKVSLHKIYDCIGRDSVLLQPNTQSTQIGSFSPNSNILHTLITSKNIMQSTNQPDLPANLHAIFQECMPSESLHVSQYNVLRSVSTVTKNTMESSIRAANDCLHDLHHMYLASQIGAAENNLTLTQQCLRDALIYIQTKAPVTTLSELYDNAQVMLRLKEAQQPSLTPPILHTRHMESIMDPLQPWQDGTDESVEIESLGGANLPNSHSEASSPSWMQDGTLLVQNTRNPGILVVREALTGTVVFAKRIAKESITTVAFDTEGQHVFVSTLNGAQIQMFEIQQMKAGYVAQVNVAPPAIRVRKVRDLCRGISQKPILRIVANAKYAIVLSITRTVHLFNLQKKSKKMVKPSLNKHQDEMRQAWDAAVLQDRSQRSKAMQKYGLRGHILSDSLPFFLTHYLPTLATPTPPSKASLFRQLMNMNNFSPPSSWESKKKLLLPYSDPAEIQTSPQYVLSSKDYTLPSPQQRLEQQRLRRLMVAQQEENRKKQLPINDKLLILQASLDNLPLLLKLSPLDPLPPLQPGIGVVRDLQTTLYPCAQLHTNLAQFHTHLHGIVNRATVVTRVLQYLQREQRQSTLQYNVPHSAIDSNASQCETIHIYTNQEIQLASDRNISKRLNMHTKHCKEYTDFTNKVSASIHLPLCPPYTGPSHKVVEEGYTDRTSLTDTATAAITSTLSTTVKWFKSLAAPPSTTLTHQPTVQQYIPTTDHATPCVSLAVLLTSLFQSPILPTLHITAIPTISVRHLRDRSLVSPGVKLDVTEQYFALKEENTHNTPMMSFLLGKNQSPVVSSTSEKEVFIHCTYRISVNWSKPKRNMNIVRILKSSKTKQTKMTLLAPSKCPQSLYALSKHLPMLQPSFQTTTGVSFASPTVNTTSNHTNIALLCSDGSIKNVLYTTQSPAMASNTTYSLDIPQKPPIQVTSKQTIVEDPHHHISLFTSKNVCEVSNCQGDSCIGMYSAGLVEQPRLKKVQAMVPVSTSASEDAKLLVSCVDSMCTRIHQNVTQNEEDMCLHAVSIVYSMELGSSDYNIKNIDENTYNIDENTYNIDENTYNIDENTNTNNNTNNIENLKKPNYIPSYTDLFKSIPNMPLISPDPPTIYTNKPLQPVLTSEYTYLDHLLALLPTNEHSLYNIVPRNTPVLNQNDTTVVCTNPLDVNDAQHIQFTVYKDHSDDVNKKCLFTDYNNEIRDDNNDHGNNNHDDNVKNIQHTHIHATWYNDLADNHTNNTSKNNVEMEYIPVVHANTPPHHRLLQNITRNTNVSQVSSHIQLQNNADVWNQIYTSNNLSQSSIAPTIASFEHMEAVQPLNIVPTGIISDTFNTAVLHTDHFSQERQNVLVGNTEVEIADIDQDILDEQLRALSIEIEKRKRQQQQQTQQEEESRKNYNKNQKHANNSIVPENIDIDSSDEVNTVLFDHAVHGHMDTENLFSSMADVEEFDDDEGNSITLTKNNEKQ